MTTPAAAPSGNVSVETNRTLVHTEGFDPNEVVHIQIDYIATDGTQLLGIGGLNTCDADGAQDYEIPVGSVQATQYSLSHKTFSFARARVWSDSVSMQSSKVA